MGKLASRELTYGSDLDVIFLYDVAEADDAALLEAQEYHVKLAQKLIWALQTRTADGLLLPDRRAPAPVRQPGHAGHLAGQLRHVSRRQRAGVGAPGAAARAADRRRRAPGRCLRRAAAARFCAAAARRRSAPRSTASACAWSGAGAGDQQTARLQDRARRHARRRERRSVPAAAPRPRRTRSCSRSTPPPRISRVSAALGLLAPPMPRPAARLGVPPAPVEPPAHRREPLDLRPRRGARRPRRAGAPPRLHFAAARRRRAARVARRLPPPHRRHPRRLRSRAGRVEEQRIEPDQFDFFTTETRRHGEANGKLTFSMASGTAVPMIMISTLAVESQVRCLRVSVPPW